MSQYNIDQDDIFNPRWLSDMLKGYRIEGNIVELYNVIFSNAQIAIHLRDIVRALSDSSINYVRVGYGETLAQAYKDAALKEGTCRLVHIYSTSEKIGLNDLYNFIKSIGEDVIFGCALDYMQGNGVKLVMIFN